MEGKSIAKDPIEKYHLPFLSKTDCVLAQERANMGPFIQTEQRFI